MIRVLIIQQYIPGYRLPLFEQLHESLRRNGIILHVAYSDPIGPDVTREDKMEMPEIGTRVATKRLNYLGKSMTLKSVNRIISTFKPDFIIAEQAVKNMENWSLLLKSTLQKGIPVALWGPGCAPGEPMTGGFSRAKSVMTNMADWFFSYTQSGAEFVISRGFKPNRVTVVHNSLDTLGLQRELGRIDEATLLEWEKVHGLTRGKTALFLGGVDARKGIEFLLDSASRIAEQLPGFILLVGGAGEESYMVTQLQRRGGPVRYLGRVKDSEKALALRSASLLLIPEWVGLVAVDSLASATPLVTTNHPSHAPEFEYLEANRTCIVTDHDPVSYANSVADLLVDSERIEIMKAMAKMASLEVQFAATVENFSEGILAWTSEESC
ncbi:glycosyltransferase family 4 protein [bacterium]|nr:glycosyltransferase family 4 protein [bacterium]